MIIKRIVCLANSRKLQGRCIAGREIVENDSGTWIRPVSNRPHEEVSEYERQYEDGSDPGLLDVIDLPLIGARPKEYQSENWLLYPDEYWVRAGKLSWDELEQFSDKTGTLWINGYHTQNGSNDHIPLAQAAAVQSSLMLIFVEKLYLRVLKPGQAFGNSKRRVQARFRFSDANYGLWITDPAIEQSYLRRPDDEYEIDDSYLTISLGEPFKESCYKLVAAIIWRD